MQQENMMPTPNEMTNQVLIYNFPSVTDRDMVLVSLPMFLCMSSPIIHIRTLYIVFYTGIFNMAANGTPKLTFSPITFFL